MSLLPKILSTVAEVKQPLKPGETLLVKNGKVLRGPTGSFR